MKECSGCGRMLSVAMFGKNTNNKDGRTDCCRDCKPMKQGTLTDNMMIPDKIVFAQNRMSQEMKRQKLTVKRLGEKTGIPWRTIQGMLNNYRTPGEAYRKRLEEALGVSLLCDIMEEYE